MTLLVIKMTLIRLMLPMPLYVMAYSMKQNALLTQTNVITTQIQRNDSLSSSGYNLAETELNKTIWKTKGDILLSLDYFSLNPEVLSFFHPIMVVIPHL